MNAFAAEYWNLCQAAVWIEYREKALVEDFSAPEGQLPDRDDYRALYWYPPKWLEGHKKHADLEEFHNRLKSNALRAKGYHSSDPDHLQDIPATQWTDMVLSPPHVFDGRNRGRELWSLVRVKRSGVLKLWPGSRPSIKVDKSQYDWKEIREIYDEARAEFKDASERRIIQEIQFRFEKRHRGRPLPSRTSLQTYMKDWSSLAT